MPGVDRTRLHSQTWQTGNKRSIYRVELKGGTRVIENIHCIDNKQCTVFSTTLYWESFCTMTKVSIFWRCHLVDLSHSQLGCHSSRLPIPSAIWDVTLPFPLSCSHFTRLVDFSIWLFTLSLGKMSLSAYHSVSLPQSPFLLTFTLVLW